jgi:hypothetical protein
LLTSRTNDWVFLLSKGTQHKVAAWTTGESHPTAIDGLKFRSAASVSGDGKAGEAALTGGSLSLTLTALPQYVTLKD